jgi:hypothetical protein
LTFQSPPNSLLATVPAGNDPLTSAVVWNAFDADGAHFVFQADLLIAPECAAANVLTPFALAFAAYRLGLVLTPSGGMLAEVPVGADGGSGDAMEYPLGTGVPTGKWFTVVMNAHLGTHTVDVAIGGAPALSGQKLNRVPATPPQHPLLLVGATVQAGGSAPASCTVHVDNVLLDVKVL